MASPARDSFGAFRLFVAMSAGLLGLGLLAHALVGTAPIVVSSYAVCLVAGAIVAWTLLIARLPSLGHRATTVYSILVGCFVAGVVGAKGAQLASDGVSGVGAGSALSGAGFGVFGAFAAGALYLSAYFRIVRPTPTLIATLDAGAAAIAANLAIGRLGCLLYGCCHGRPTNAPWPLSIALDTFAPTSPARLAHAAAEPGTRLWASQPLELVGAAVLAFALHRAARGSLAGTGRAVGVAALAYGLLRFGLEFLRDDSAAVLGPFNAWQLASVFLASWGAHRLSHSYSLRRSQA